MADEKKHANDEYATPGPATSPVPPPPDLSPETLEKANAEARENAEEPSEPRDPAARRQQAREKADAKE